MTVTSKYMSIDSVVSKTQWGEGLRKSMISDFVSSGYGNVAPLIGKDPQETSKNIQRSIIGFASDKNTYLQANMLAEIIHKMLESRSSAPKSYPKKASAKVDYPMGEVLSDCGGWVVYKKTLPDARVVYNAKIKPDTPPNKTDWQTIKNEVYLQTTFKWGRFGAFEKWGQVDKEEAMVNRLCEILSKYYQPSSSPKEEPRNNSEKNAEYWANYLIVENGIIWDKLGISSGSQLKADESLQEKYKNMFVGVFSYITAQALPDPIKGEIREIISEKNEHSLNNALGLAGFYGSNVASSYLQFYKDAPANWLNPKYYGYTSEEPKPESNTEPTPPTETEKEIELYLDGMFVDYVSSQEEAYEMLTKNFGETKFKEMLERGQAYYNMSKNRIDVLRGSFIYGYKWSVPKKFGNELQFDFINRGFKVYISAKNNQLVIYKNDMVSDGLIINDNGGEFNIDKYGYNISVGSVNYVIGDDMKPVSPSIIAGMIENIYNNERGAKTTEETPATTGKKSKEEISKAIKGLQYLADKGNEKAIKAIKGLQYLLNK